MVLEMVEIFCPLENYGFADTCRLNHRRTELQHILGKGDKENNNLFLSFYYISYHYKISYTSHLG